MQRPTLLAITLSTCLALLMVLVCCPPERLLVAGLKEENRNDYINFTGCIHAYMEDGTYHITIPEGDPQKGQLTKPTVVKGSTSCPSAKQPTGQLSLLYQIGDDNMESMTLDYQIRLLPAKGYWEIEGIMLHVVPNNKGPYSETDIPLKASYLYAGSGFSFSCNSLVLQNLMPTKLQPLFKLTINRFQIQPFGELEKSVFAPSYDCSVWLSIPVIMGFALLLFITFVVLIGVYLLMELGNQTCDLKFSKQGGMLMNQAQLDATKG